MLVTQALPQDVANLACVPCLSVEDEENPPLIEISLYELLFMKGVQWYAMYT